MEFNKDGSIKVPDNILKSQQKEKETRERRLKAKKQLKNSFFREKVSDKYNNKCNHCPSKGKGFFLYKRK